MLCNRRLIIKRRIIQQEAIAAISTPLGVGAVSIIRISGKNALKIADKVFEGAIKPSAAIERYMNYGRVHSKYLDDACLMVVFRSPRSYTAEDIVEFQVHGGQAITERLLHLLLDKGARMAQPGEFTRRAFMNGKTDLTGAEGVADMINAQSAGQIKAAYSLIDRSLNAKLDGVYAALADTLAQIEVSLDYPEEDIEFITLNKAALAVQSALGTIKILTQTYNAGYYIKGGVNVVITGKTNVGKSTVMNALLKKDRSIVTDIPGTTRDTVTESYEYKGVMFNITDTAGIREPGDEIERLGIERTLRALAAADIIIYIVDNESSVFEYSAFSEYADRGILVWNKNDLMRSPIPSAISISARAGDVDALKNAVYARVFTGKIPDDSIIITSQRHFDALNRAGKALKCALCAQEPELMATDIKDALGAIGEITGKTASEEVIDGIFSKFCLGK